MSAIAISHMSRRALELHLAYIDDRIEKSIIVVGFLEEYIDGSNADILNHSIQVSIEMAREAQHEIERLRVAAGIEAEVQVTE
jgi:hypothetical protein